MEKTKVLIAAVLVCLAAVAISPSVSAESDITVTVNGEAIADGETVQVESSPVVNVTVESDTTLTSVRTVAGGSYSVVGADGSSYTTSRTVSVLGETEFSVTANEEGGESYTHTVVLTRPSETPRDLQRDVRSLRDGIESMEGEVDRLEQRRNELRQRNENLTRRLNETRAQLENTSDDGDSGESDGQGMPGFTAVAALVAASVVGFAVSRRTR